MSFTIRKSELEAIQAVLTDGTFANETEMAKALIQTMVTELEKRESYSYVYRTDGGLTILWPFWYEGQARRFHRDYGLPDVGGNPTWRIYKTRAPQVDRDLVKARQEEYAEKAQEMKDLNWPKAAENPSPEGTGVPASDQSEHLEGDEDDEHELDNGEADSDFTVHDSPPVSADDGDDDDNHYHDDQDYEETHDSPPVDPAATDDGDVDAEQNVNHGWSSAKPTRWA